MVGPLFSNDGYTLARFSSGPREDWLLETKVCSSARRTSQILPDTFLGPQVAGLRFVERDLILRQDKLREAQLHLLRVEQVMRKTMHIGALQASGDYAVLRQSNGKATRNVEQALRALRF